VTPAEIREFADRSRIESCEAQGVEPVITDPVVVAQVAELAGDWWRKRAASADRSAA
jgi:hypothetical protein